MTKYYGEEKDNSIYKGIDKNAFTFIDEATKGYGDYTALSYFSNKITYNEFKEKVNIYASNLLSYGLQPRDSVALLMPNIPEIVYYFYACWALGVRVSPIDPRTNPDGICDIINTTASKLLVAILDKYAEKVSPIIDKINVDKIVIVSPTDSMGTLLKENIGRSIYKFKEYFLYLIEKDFSSSKIVMNRNFIDNKRLVNVKPVFYETELGMPAVNLFTSGTEGSPKTALHSQQAYNVKAKQMEYAAPGAIPGDKFLGIIPFFSAYGSFQGMHHSLYRGMNIDLIPKFDTAKVPELIIEHQPNVVIGVPNYWHDFRNRIDYLMEAYGLKQLSFLKYAVSGGDKQPSADVKELIEILHKYCPNCIFVRGYGSTEVGGATTATVDDESYEDYEYTGIPMPGVDFIIENKDENGVGEILISDPSLMIEYYNNPEETNKAITVIDGKRYMKMGDLFSSDSLGRIHFEGRIKRAIMRPDGHTVHVVPIEETINANGLVEHCCVVGLGKKNGTSGTIPTAFVVLKDEVEESQDTANRIDTFCLEKLSERNRALAYVFVERIPKTLMDKDDFKTLEKNFIEDVPYYPVDYSFLNKDLHSVCPGKKGEI